MNSISLASCSQALEYAMNHVGTCKVIITVVSNDGTTIGTETLGDASIMGLVSVKSRCEKYENHLSLARSRMRKYSGKHSNDITIAAVDPSRGCF